MSENNSKQQNQKEKIHYLKDYRAPEYMVKTIDMQVDIKPDACTIKTKLNIIPAADIVAGKGLFLHGEELKLLGISLDGKVLEAAEFEQNQEGIILHNPPANPFELATIVTVKPEQNTSLMGLYRSGGTWCTQCEPEGFRRLSFMLDRPDIMATYRVRLEADKDLAPILLSNGNLIKRGEIDNNRHFAIWEDPHPKPTYLFALVAGNLEALRDDFTTMSGKKIALAIYCEPGKSQKCTYAMGALKRSMEWDEERFGREYDLEQFNIVAVSDFNFGAMENKGLNIFNDKYILADPDSATDRDYYNIERIVAHEYFHNWTGNRITCRDWFQLCLKEGLTVYRDQEFTSDMRSRSVKRISDARNLRAHQFGEDCGPLAHPPRPDHYAQINNFYTSTVYDKGAEIVRMLATILGAEEFAKGCDLYFERHDGQATTIEKWIKVFEDSSGRDLSQFAKWYTQAGTPEVFASGIWDEKSKTYMLKLKQVNKANTGQTKKLPSKLPMYIPLKFALIGPNGKDLMFDKVSGGEVEDDILILRENEMDLRFEGVSQRPTLSILREFSAPVSLISGQSQNDKVFLARHDRDPFNRWQAGQSLAMDMLVKTLSNNDGKIDFDPDEVKNLANAIQSSLASQIHDNAFKTLVLTPPGETAIALSLKGKINPKAIYLARLKLVQLISKILKQPLLELYEKLAASAPYSQSLAQVQARSLRNQCLVMLAAQNDRTMDELASKQYYENDNMSDRMGALAAIVMGWNENSLEHLNHFKSNFGSNPLIYDKWLMLMAQAPDADCLGRVKEIYHSQYFPKTNPNRLRALIGGFAVGNPAQFTREDAGGFEFVAGAAREIDTINPQVSASIIEGFRSFRNWETNRETKAEEILQNLANKKANSSDLSDILNRLLAR